MQKPGLWKTKDGKVMLIKDLTTPHLLNAIAILEQRSSQYPGLYSEKLDELWDEARNRFPQRISKQENRQPAAVRAINAEEL